MGPLPLPSVFSYIVSQVSTIRKFNDAIFSDKKLLLKRLTIICHKRYTKKNPECEGKGYTRIYKKNHGWVRENGNTDYCRFI